MSAYIIVDIAVENEEVFQEYVSKADALLQQVPGFSNLSVERNPKVLEGKWDPAMIVVHEFPNYETAKQFYYSEEYASLIKLRQSASEASVILVNGR